MPKSGSSLPRRIFIFVALGAGVLALLGSVSFLIFVFLRDALEGELALTVLREAKVAIGIIAAAAMFLPYYWMVYRQDRQAEPEVAVVAPERTSRKGVAVLVNQGGDAFVRDLEAALGYEVAQLRWADPDATLPQLSEVEFQELTRAHRRRRGRERAAGSRRCGGPRPVVQLAWRHGNLVVAPRSYLVALHPG